MAVKLQLLAGNHACTHTSRKTKHIEDLKNNANQKVIIQRNLKDGFCTFYLTSSQLAHVSSSIVIHP